jgi:multidrug efflux pump subunit AcrB
MSLTTVRTYDDMNKINLFQELTAEDVTGNGTLKPIAARHFAEKAQQVQDLSNFRMSAAGSDPALLQHFSTVQEAKLWEALLEIEPYNIVQPYVRIAEQKDAQMYANIGMEQMATETMTPSGLTPDQYTDEETNTNPMAAGPGAGPGPGQVL